MRSHPDHLPVFSDPQGFGHSNCSGRHQPQHPRAAQELHPQSRPHGESRYRQTCLQIQRDHSALEELVQTDPGLKLTADRSSGCASRQRLTAAVFHCSAGRNGVSITLVTQYDIHLVHSIEEQIRKSLCYKLKMHRWHTRILGVRFVF